MQDTGRGDRRLRWGVEGDGSDRVPTRRTREAVRSAIREVLGEAILRPARGEGRVPGTGRASFGGDGASQARSRGSFRTLDRALGEACEPDVGPTDRAPPDAGQGGPQGQRKRQHTHPAGR